MGGGGPSSLKFLHEVDLGGCVKFLKIFLEGVGGGWWGGFRATWKPLWVHPWDGSEYPNVVF